MLQMGKVQQDQEFYRESCLSRKVWSLTLGMPHLADRGLNENWVYRECGHTHWGLISTALSCSSEQIVDASGRRLYASFVTTRISGSLGPFRENEQLRIESVLSALSGKRFVSRHLIQGERGSVELSMVSTFIKQKHPADNRAFISTPPDVRELTIKKSQCDLLDDYRKSRTCLAMKPIVPQAFSYQVVPAVDFNGAQFLYFANFHTIEDRAYHYFTGHSSFHTIDRSIYFFGNLNRSETVEAFLLSHEIQMKIDTALIVLRRKSDHNPLAVVSTRRFVG